MICIQWILPYHRKRAVAKANSSK